MFYEQTRSEKEPISSGELDKAIKRLKWNKATGPDGILNELLLEADKHTKTALLKIIKNIHHDNKIPDQWRIGTITRIYKGKGDRGMCSNQRPPAKMMIFSESDSRFMPLRSKQLVSLRLWSHSRQRVSLSLMLRSCDVCCAVAIAIVEMWVIDALSRVTESTHNWSDSP